MTSLAHARVSSSVSWPEDDSYRGHIDRYWLGVLAAGIRTLTTVVPMHRHFVVFAYRAPAS